MWKKGLLKTAFFYRLSLLIVILSKKEEKVNSSNLKEALKAVELLTLKTGIECNVSVQQGIGPSKPNF